MHFRAIISLGNNLFARKVSKSIFTVFANLGSSPYKDSSSKKSGQALHQSVRTSFGHSVPAAVADGTWSSQEYSPSLYSRFLQLAKTPLSFTVNSYSNLASVYSPDPAQRPMQEASAKCTSSKTILIW